MIDLNGTYTHNVDAKGRLALPAKFRKKLPEELIVTRDITGRCLYVFDEEDYSAWIEAFFAHDGGYDPLNINHINLRSSIKELAEDVNTDSAGRINLPKALLDQVGITKEVTLIGNSGYFEIWDTARREEERAKIDLTSFLRS